MHKLPHDNLLETFPKFKSICCTILLYCENFFFFFLMHDIKILVKRPSESIIDNYQKQVAKNFHSTSPVFLHFTTVFQKTDFLS